MRSRALLLWTAVLAASACGAATDPELGYGPFGAPCAEATSPCLPEGGRITLGRTPCFGACPVYEVSVDWTGLVVYEGELYVAVEGHRERQVGADETASLFWRLHAASFFDLRERYETFGDGCEVVIDDTAGLRLGLELPGRSKVARVGGCVGSDDADTIERIATEVDEVAGTEEWR